MVLGDNILGLWSFLCTKNTDYFCFVQTKKKLSGNADEPGSAETEL